MWVWNAFNRLSTSRLGTDHPIPSDWLHGNSVSWSPEDGDLVVSLRTQDWAIKINYANGTGNGRSSGSWGPAEASRPIANASQPWFTHQHDVRYVDDTHVVVFDDGNTRQETFRKAHSRGQEWVLNEQNMTATLLVNADMGNYSAFLGSCADAPERQPRLHVRRALEGPQWGRPVNPGAPEWHQGFCATNEPV